MIDMVPAWVHAVAAYFYMALAWMASVSYGRDEMLIELCLWHVVVVYRPSQNLIR